MKAKKLKANFKTTKEGSRQIFNIIEKLTDINLEAWECQITGKSYEGVEGEGRVAYYID